MTADGQVDVILTCYNEGPYIKAAVQSVLDQTTADRIETITIADDGSADDTVNVLRALPSLDPRIRILLGDGGAGISRQRNLAASIGQARYVAILDGDDIWAADKLERQLPILDDDAQIGMVFSDYYVFASDHPENVYSVKISDFTKSKNLALQYFLDAPPILPSASIIRRSSLEQVGEFDETVEVFEDTDFFFRLARICRFGFVQEPLTSKRVHSASITESRNDLLAHQAFVSFRAAALEPSLLKHVPLRLSERARKLGNRAFMFGDTAKARDLLSVAFRLAPLNYRAWPYLVVVNLAPGLGRRYLGAFHAKQLSAIGTPDGR